MDIDNAASQDGAGYGLTEGSTVQTLRGPQPVENLRPGDRIVTRAGALRLTEVEERIVARARLMRVSASALGPDRPEADIVLAADQPILLRDWRAPALAGTDRAMIPATRLADGEYIRAEARRDVRLFLLRFDVPAVIYAQGLELACEGAMATA
ncbi:MAG: Hint domain-containing protein [Paracoccaceae bacterium]|nr:MAG: Hint domain-containing protein [Paracoccaceae bacterium]